MGSLQDSIAFRILTPSVDIHERFRTEERLEEVFNWAMAAISYSRSQGEFNLHFGQEPLDLSRPIFEYVERFGWKDGTTLELVPRPVPAGVV